MIEHSSDMIFDFLIVGSGFGGSIIAMGLAECGFKTLVIEKGQHPRFTVGESSTPIADMVLRRLSDEYNLPFLKQISRYGEWQKHHPNVTCGLKRGFSYYRHFPGKPFKSNECHDNELLVAASENDFNSDTNWLRSDVDHFLVSCFDSQNVEYSENTTIKRVQRERKSAIWKVSAESEGSVFELRSRWIIDATGSPVFSENYFGVTSSAREFETSSSALFTHLKGAETWLDYLKKNEFKTNDYPYNPDHSALHHIIDEGWMWMLRFNNDLLSTGILFDGNSDHGMKDPHSNWINVIEKYPSLHQLFLKSELADMPGEWIQTKRLQRKLSDFYGDGWVALNHTAGFVDPMHSTGIAHTLTGIEKLLDIFSKEKEPEKIETRLNILQDDTQKELTLIDLLVSSSYKSRSDFNLFRASVMLYFIASVKYEQSRLNGLFRTHFCVPAIRSCFQ